VVIVAMVIPALDLQLLQVVLDHGQLLGLSCTLFTGIRCR
jgi:hypothetical protein